MPISVKLANLNKNRGMKHIHLYLCYLFGGILCILLSGCTQIPEEEIVPGGEGNATIRFAVSAPQEVTTRSSEGDNRIETALVFAFDTDNRCVARQWSYLSGTNAMYMYLPSGQIRLCAICNLLDPESTMNQVNSWDDLKHLNVTITNASDAYRGKCIMYGTTDFFEKPDDRTTAVPISVDRIAAKFDVKVLFSPLSNEDQFQISEIVLHNIPKGSWLMPRNEDDRTVTDNNSDKYRLLMRGSTDDWVYNEVSGNMSLRYFDKSTLSFEGNDPKQGVNASFYLFENRRGQLDTSLSSPPQATDPYAINWPDLYDKDQAQRQLYAQLWKKELADQAQLDYATYLTVKGIYAMGQYIRREVTYYIYLGEDNFSNYDIERNKYYDLEVTIRTIDNTDTRVNWKNLSEITAYYDESNILDAHCNSVRTLLYAPGDWEMWVEDPDQHPWVELSRSSVYQPRMLGSGADDLTATTRLSGSQGIHTIYVHTDEFVPDISSPGNNTEIGIRSATILYHKVGSNDEPYRFEVKQYPAQMVVLHIKYDIHSMQEVRDTLYIERILEKKHLKWGLERYWSFVTDELIASGQWDGLSNTRKIYNVALYGDKYGVSPAYQPDEGEEVTSQILPNNITFRYIIDKNRDRNGNGSIDYDEIMWYMPSIQELSAIYEARQDLFVDFEGNDDYFFSSTPSSADPEGKTAGFAYYIKMASGKTGIAQRDNEYNVIACRRANAWRGPSSSSGSGSLNKDDSWEEEENIMPK